MKNNSTYKVNPFSYPTNSYRNPYKDKFSFEMLQDYETLFVIKMLNKIYDENNNRKNDHGCFICGDSPAYLETSDNPMSANKKITIKCCPEHEINIHYLRWLIQYYDYTINEDIIRKAINVSCNFENLWKCDISYRICNMTSPELISGILDFFLDTTKDFKYHIDHGNYRITSLRRSYRKILVVFHSFGFYLQVNSLMNKNKLNLIYLAILQYSDAISTNFSKIVKYYDYNKPTFITAELICGLEEMIRYYPGKEETNLHYNFEDISTLGLTKKYKEELERSNLDFTLYNLWNNIIKKHICEYSNLNYLKKIVRSNEYKYDKFSDIVFISMFNDSNKYDFSHINIMSMFNAAGLLYMIEFSLLLEDYNMLVSSIEQFMHTLTSKFNFAMGTTVKDKELYKDLTILLNTYRNEFE